MWPPMISRLSVATHCRVRDVGRSRLTNSGELGDRFERRRHRPQGKDGLAGTSCAPLDNEHGDKSDPDTWEIADNGWRQGPLSRHAHRLDRTL